MCIGLCCLGMINKCCQGKKNGVYVLILQYDQKLECMHCRKSDRSSEIHSHVHMPALFGHDE